MQPKPLVCFLTGAARGIGRGVAQALYAEGHSLFLTDVNLALLQEYTQAWDMARVHITALDVRNPAAWKQAMETALEYFGRVDVGMNIAGVIRPAFIRDLSLEDVDFMVDINLKGVMYGTKVFSTQMLRQGGGQIINIASLAGVAPIVGLPIYSATKFGVRAFSIAAAQELRAHHIYVSVVCPDLVNTQMLTLQLDHEAANLTFSGERVLTVDEITRVILHKALNQRKLEVMYPPYRGFLGRIANFFPAIAPLLAGILTKKGQKNRTSWHKNQGSSGH